MLPNSQVESSTRGRRAFTLIELLVVVAILGLLFSLLLPALNRAKDTSKRAVCLNNLKQLTAAWHFYCDDNEDRPPMNIQATQLNNVASNWVWNVMTYETKPPPPSPSTLADSADKALLVNSKKSLLGPYVGSADVFRCPADRSFVRLPTGDKPRVRSYSMNSHIGRHGPQFRSLFLRTAFLFVEEHEDSIFGGNFRFDLGSKSASSAYIFNQIPTARHRGAGSVSFTDGSAVVKEWNDPSTRVPVLRRFQSGVPSPNSPDVEWFAKQNVY